MLIGSIILLISVLISLPLLVIGIESCIAMVKSYRKELKVDIQELDDSVSVAILIPAHNEEIGIAETLRNLTEQVKLGTRIVVIADNCKDKTAEIARSFDVEVVERQHETNRGKGFALDFGIQFLNDNTPPDVLIIMDADCIAENSALKKLTLKVLANNRPAQALYLMRIDKNASVKRRVAGFAWMVKNKIRLLALDSLGLPVTLTGTGMAFPWNVIGAVNLDHDNIVEDMLLGIDCTIKGFPPVFCQEARVYSEFPEQESAINSQRTRWEHGHLMIIIRQVPRLLRLGIARRDLKLLGMALDISVPPLAFLVICTVTGLFLLFIYGWLTNQYLAFGVLFSVYFFFMVSLFGIWWREGRDYLSFSDLISIPGYITSKISIYLMFIFHRQKEWVRTDRGGLSSSKEN